MKLLKLITSILFAALLFSGCAQWQQATGPQTIKSQKITYDLKDQKWQALNNETFETCVLTKDGLGLQSVNISRIPFEKALEKSKKELTNEMLPHELADLIIENLRLIYTQSAFKLLSNEPEMIDTKDAVNIVYQIEDTYQNKVKVNASYFIFDEKLYIVSYSAPMQHYYKRDINHFKEIKKSIKITM